MNILHLHKGPDTGGQSMAGKRVLEAAGHSVRVFVGSYSPLGYPQAELWDDDAVREAYAWADTVVLHNYPRYLFNRVDDGSRKRLVVHHHGTRFRLHPDEYYAQAADIGARQIVSTVDLLLSVPRGGRAEWFPQVVDMDLMAEVRRDTYRPGDLLRIAHAPTQRQIKGTRHFIRATREFQSTRERSGLAEFLLIERQPWRRCLELKARADIFFDQPNLGYGNNAIEAWAMGLPVIAGATLPILTRMRQTFGDLPFYLTTPLGLLEAIRAMLDSSGLRAEYAERGMAHVQRFHAPEAWRRRAELIYGSGVAAQAA